MEIPWDRLSRFAHFPLYGRMRAPEEHRRADLGCLHDAGLVYTSVHSGIFLKTNISGLPTILSTLSCPQKD